MKSQSLQKLSWREQELFDIVLAGDAMTLSEILAKMERPPTRQAVRAMLMIVEKKGYIDRAKSGREYIFSPTVSGKSVARSLFRDLVNKMFGSSLKNALVSHLEDETVKYSKEEVREIIELFERRSKE